MNTWTKLSHSVSVTSVVDFNAVENQEHEKCKNVSPLGPFANSHRNVCSESAGARVIFATDDWFATAENLLKDSSPMFDDELYCEQGKVMDGWETRRRREEGHDWCLIKSADSGARISGIEIDTAHFSGNHVPKISIEAANVKANQISSIVNQLPNGISRLLNGGVQGTGHSPEEVRKALKAIEHVEWNELLPPTPLMPGYERTRLHYFTLNNPIQGSIIKVNYYPDGGVARLRLWAAESNTETDRSKLYMPIETGAVATVVSHSSTGMLPSQLPYSFPELSSRDEGGLGISCSNKHYGEPWRLTQACIGKGMWDGWETARHPDRPGILIKDPKTKLIDSSLMDWCILKLGKEAVNGVARVILDTRHFFGNYPESVLLEGCNGFNDEGAMDWFPLVNRVRMSPDSEHVFEKSLGQLSNASRPVTHVRLSIFPDGGVSRVRVYG